jgi:micrococcal nuclease
MRSSRWTGRVRLALGVVAVATAVILPVFCVHVHDGVSPSPSGGASPSPSATSATPCAEAGTVSARVTKVTDGDTIHAAISCGPESGVAVTVRIIGMNTPETKKPGTPVQCYGPQASARALAELGGKDVALVSDRRAGRVDKYGRRLYHVEVGGSDYAAETIRAGYAEWNDYGHPEDRSDTYMQAETQARFERVGAWGACPRPFKG